MSSQHDVRRHGIVRLIVLLIIGSTAMVSVGAAPAVAAAKITWSTSVTVSQTVTVTESAVVKGVEGYGTATVTKTATATGTATAATYWELYYYATMDAHAKAVAAANASADAEARAVAKQRALADATARAASVAPAGPCGAAISKADGTPWDCTFSDTFSGTTLDTTRWSPIDTSTSGFTYGDCFQGLSDNVVVANGSLNLTTEKEAAPVTCSRYGKTFRTSYTSGAVTSLGTFSQTYGRVEIRAAMPATTGPGLQSALWMVPDAPAYYGAWPGSGEMDISEFYSNYPDRIIPTVHYNSKAPFDERTNNECLVYRPTDFHTYVLEWTPAKIKVSVDGTTCLDHAIAPSAPLSGSAPFNRPFNLNLTQMLGSNANAMPAGKSVKATMKVDYVRVWS